MKRTVSAAFLAAVMLVFVSGSSQARSWRVNNNAARAPHFADINAACSSDQVQDGDTLYLDPDCTLTAAQTVSKTLTIIGTGYFLTGVPYSPATISGTLTLNAQNCKAEGLQLAAVTIKADNVTIERCKTAGNISWSTTGTNAIIRQCYVEGIIVGMGNTNANSAGCIIENCIVVNTNATGVTGTSNVIRNLYQASIRNNYLKRTYSMNSSDCVIYNCYNSSVTNNIIYNTKSTTQVLSSTDNTAVSNNVMSSASNSSYPENTFLGVASEATVFALAGNNDERYQLKDDSPAKGYATDGGDCGPFGGLFPYVLSGHPAGMPYFVSTNTPTRSTNGQVKITQHVKLQTK